MSGNRERELELKPGRNGVLDILAAAHLVHMSGLLAGVSSEAEV